MSDHIKIDKTIREWCITIHEWAIRKGWWEDFDGATEKQVLADKGINIVQEVGELWESSRQGLLDSPCDKAEKMRAAGTPVLTYGEEELADIVIRVMDLAEYLEIDLQSAIEAKHAFNETRPHKHGKVH